MRKFLPALVLLSFFAVLAAPLIVSAAGPQECCKLKRAIEVDGLSLSATTIVGASGGVCDITGTVTANDKWGLYCIINTIQTVVDWVFTFLVVLTILFVILGAYEIITSAGSPEKITSGRNHILYAAIGLIVAFIARAVPTLVKSIMG